jgi:hypothetical protein
VQSRLPPLKLTLYCWPYHQASALYPVINYYERLAGIAHDDSQAQKLAELESLLLENGAVLERTVPILATFCRFRWAIATRRWI